MYRAALSAFLMLLFVMTAVAAPRSVKDFGAKGDGKTDDSAAINRAIADVISSGGGSLFFPAAPNCYITSSQLLIDLSSITTLFLGRIQLKGEGSASTCIQNQTLVGAGVLKIVGSATNPESYFAMEGIRLLNDGVNPPANTIGLETHILAFASFRDVFLEGFDYGWDAYDTEQVGIYDSYIRYNNHGIRANAAKKTSNPNSWSYFNTAVSNNYVWGLLHATGFSLYYAGGSIQGNGKSGCADCWGVSLQNMGYGAGASFDSVDMEANTGVASLISNQTQAGGATVSTFSLRNVTFQRHAAAFTKNDILIQGDLLSFYKLSTNVFLTVNGYVPSKERPRIAIDNPAAKIDDDGTNWFQSSEEGPEYTAGQMVTRPVAR